MSGSRQLIQYSFNDEGTKFTASTERLFAIYSSLDFTKLAASTAFGGVRSINCLHHADLYLLVASGDKPGASPRRAKIWRDSQLIQEIALPTTVEHTQWNKTHLVLFTDNQIFVYELRTLSLKATLNHFPGNNCGAMGVSDSNILCYPCPNVLGQVIVHDCKENRLLHRFAAHRTEVSRMAMNTTGTMLCTASKAGTLIRVFQIPSGDLLYTFRISNTNNSITSLQFCAQNSNYLLCGSGKNMWSVCYLGEKTQRSIDDIVNERTLETTEEGDFCRVEVNHEGEEEDESAVGTDSKSFLTHQSRADTDQSAGVFSLATAQYLFDFTMKSVQQIRNISQDYLQPEMSSSAAASEAACDDSVTIGHVPTGRGTRKMRLQNDIIRSADWQCTINIDDFPCTGCLVVDDVSENADGDDISTLAGSVTGGDTVSGELSDSWKLQLLILSKTGVYRKYSLLLPGHSRGGVTSTRKQQLTSPMLSGKAAESVLHLEDEKFIFDFL